MKSSEIRSAFIDFFKSKNHTFVPATSTIPIGDQTILFTIAGMTQFKNALTGAEKRPYNRATNAQKCIRIGDLDDVGKDGRHLTMFEMMGSWSFGDYYKRDAIAWAFELTKDVLKYPMDRFWATVHESDDEAFGMWEKLGQPKERIRRLGDKDNFWAMGPTGPCGPCSELYLDQGAEVGKCADPKFDCKAGPGCDCDRYLEYWNLVFMQYDRQEDGTLKELPFKSVDTGAGLERLTALSQGKTTAFEIDSMAALRKAILRRAGQPDSGVPTNDLYESLNVVTDHIRTLCFTLADGAHFSSEGRGYVLRRVLRRAVRHAHRLQPKAQKGVSFLADIVRPVVEEFGGHYPELKEHETKVTEAIRAEELRFQATLESGLAKFQAFVAEARAQKRSGLSGQELFALHDTFGFPADLTRVLCEEQGLAADVKGFQAFMNKQREKSRLDSKFYKFDEDDSPWLVLAHPDPKATHTFSGYGVFPGETSYQGSAIYLETLPAERVYEVRQLKNNQYELILGNTPFYPEGGGQAADVGWIKVTHGNGGSDLWEVLDVRKSPRGIVHVLHHAETSGAELPRLSPDALKALFSGTFEALVDADARAATARNHTATHLLHKALQVVLGPNVRQAGSQVNPVALRFDFSHGKALSEDEKRRVEDLVNAQILRNTKVKTHQDVPIAHAKEMGAMAMFDEKYDDVVRVLEVPGFSLELCGGTHVAATGDIGLFKLTAESSVTSGVRRIEAVTGKGALALVREQSTVVAAASASLKCAPADLLDRLEALQATHKELERTIEKLQGRVAGGQLDGLLKAAQELPGGAKLVAATLEVGDAKELEILADRIKEKEAKAVVVLAAVLEGKAVVLASVSKALATGKMGAGAIVKHASQSLGGNGGGRPDFARGGGPEVAKLPEMLAGLPSFIAGLMQ